MAKRSKSKTVEVQKFGGAESLGSVREEGNLTPFHSELSNQDYIHENVSHDLIGAEAKSETTLEMDEGGGGAAIVRMFEFGINPQAFKEYQPTKQELFNSHYKGIEIALWKDGMKVIPEVNPRIVIMEKEGKYRIFVGAAPMKGHILKEQPKTLKEMIHGGV